jgi:IS605 OrfB family transposase
MFSINNFTTKTLRLRLKDKHSGFLREQARAVNTVWNYCNELSFTHWVRKRAFFSAYDMQPYTKGAGKELRLHSQTVQAIQEEYCTRRKQHKKVKLRWRVSHGARRSLDWIPFKASAIRYRNGQVWYAGRALSLWDSYGLADYELGSGTISEDSRGRWYINITVKVRMKPRHTASRAVGIDLGLADAFATSDGHIEPAKRFYRDLEPKLAAAQRANNKQRVKAIHAKIANRRKHELHKLSSTLVDAYGAIFVGNVNAAALAKTRMVKSVLDAGWGSFRSMLQYKCDDAGVWFEEVYEAFSSQTCSSCGALPDSRSKGIAGLGIREWTCSPCHSVHHRDINAAKNILARGRAGLAVGISVP